MKSSIGRPRNRFYGPGANRGGYVLLSLEDYQQLIERLKVLADRAFGERAKLSLDRSRMVGTETFTEELARLAVLDDGDSVSRENTRRYR